MLVGLVILAAGLLWTASTDTVGALIASRCAAGVGAALVFPATLASITAALPPERRRTGVGLWAASTVVGAAFGLLLCAVCTDLLTWQAPFFVFAAIVVALAGLTAAVVPETRSEHHVPVDPVGALTAVGAAGGITLAVSEGPVQGWTAAITVLSGLGGLVLLGAFVARELHVEHPLLDVRLFADRRFGGAAAALFTMFFAHYALFTLAFQYQGYALGYSTLQSSLGILPPLVGFALIPAGPALVRRVGRRATVVGGLLLGAMGTSLAAAMVASGTASYWTFACGTAVMWCGMGVAMAPPTEMILEAVPRAQQGVASAVNDLTRELGAAFGIAITGSAFNAAYRGSVGGHLGVLPQGLAGGSASRTARGRRRAGDPRVRPRWRRARLAVGPDHPRGGAARRSGRRGGPKPRAPRRARPC